MAEGPDAPEPVVDVTEQARAKSAGGRGQTFDGPPDEAQLDVLRKIGERTPEAITNLQRLLAEIGDE